MGVQEYNMEYLLKSKARVLNNSDIKRVSERTFSEKKGDYTQNVYVYRAGELTIGPKSATYKAIRIPLTEQELADLYSFTTDQYNKQNIAVQVNLTKLALDEL